MSTMEDLFGSGSDSDGSGDDRRMSTGSVGGAGGNINNDEANDLPSTQAHMDELFGGESDDSNQQKNDSDGKDNSYYFCFLI